MTKFIYKARRDPQHLISGEVEAPGPEQAISKIMQSGLFPFEIREEKPKEEQKPACPSKVDKIGRWARPAAFLQNARGGARRKMLADFTRQLSDLISSSIGLLKAVDIVRAQSANPFWKSILDRISSLIKDGRDLSDALSRHPEIFNDVYVSLVRSGELSGRLAEILSRTAQLIQKDYETRSQIASSLIYPFFVLGVGLITVVILLVGVIPRVAEIFEDMNQALPWATQVLISSSHALVHFWWLMAGLLAIGLRLFNRWHRSPPGKLWTDDFLIKLPVAGDFLKSIELGRLMRTMSTLLESGIVIDRALRSAKEVLDNAILKRELERIMQEVINGSSLKEALKHTRCFSESAIGIIAVSEASGRLPQGLSRLADSYERHAEGTSKVMISVLEPAMILVVGLFVGFIVMALILPIVQMNLLIQ